MSINDRYAETLGPLVYGDTEAFVRELEQQFSIGSSPDLLPDSERRAYDMVVDRMIAAHRASDPPDAADIYAADSVACDLALWEPSAGRDHALAEEEREFFAHYGISPGHSLKTLSRNAIAKIGGSIGRINQHGPTGTSVGYLFCKPLFELATNPEIVGRVTSLLGDDVTCVGTSGPMYIAPGAKGTEWHFAGGRDFGGENEAGLDLVTVWLALSDVPRARAPMKMLTRSFPGNLALYRREKEVFGGASTVPPVASAADGDPIDAYLIDVLTGLERIPFRTSEETIKKIVARRFNSRRISELQFVHEAAPRYNAFHARIDALMCVGPYALRKGGSRDMIAMEAKPGDIYMFTSMNTHGSLPNLTSEWRHAIAIRYVKSGHASANLSDNHFGLLNTYARLFPETEAIYQAVGKQIGEFEHVAPRIAVSGDIPSEVAQYYWDTERLQEALRERPLLGRQIGA